MNIVNVSESNPAWCWLEPEFKDPSLQWVNYSNQSYPVISRLPKGPHIARAMASRRGASYARRNPPSILVSHGHNLAFHTSTTAKLICPDVPMLAYTFCFVGDLPFGSMRKLMTRAFTQPKKFVVFTNMERKIYSEYFEIPIDLIDMIHWNIHPPMIEQFSKPTEKGDYICALGSMGRDYKTLFAAMKRLPRIKLLVVAAPQSIEGLEIPDNVKLHTNIPLDHAYNILANSRFMVLPLKDGKTPVGHMTIVSSLFLRKTVLVTDAESIYEYIEDGVTGLYYENRNEADLAKKIEALWDDTANRALLSDAAYTFAMENCSQKASVNYFTNFLISVAT